MNQIELTKINPKDILNKVPLPVLSWLKALVSQGWQAQPPSSSEELKRLVRKEITPLWKHWKPVHEGSVEDKATLVDEIMMTLSVYGYGALPSDPLQSKAKVKGFEEVLEECPLWAIQSAGKLIRKTHEEAPVPATWLRLSRKEMGWNEKLEWGEGVYDVGWAYEKIVEWMKQQNGGENHAPEI